MLPVSQGGDSRGWLALFDRDFLVRSGSRNLAQNESLRLATVSVDATV